ncbi:MULTISPECIES: iron response transcriptional regulator IrrA [unclassified Roseitalea]|uniref:iron response transcriptional regulator IrrA n=1 Tax=unclassified Roseitalea TaxID=2639107 RepID=UPI00273CFDF6|nr:MULTISPECIES: Fur family transcriptional regulator [unclassified Roseitalea]
MSPIAESRPHKADTRTILQSVGLRPTRQRVALADMLFADSDRHIAAEDLHREAVAAGVPVSLATVYNTLHQFTEAGLLRILAVEGQRTYFDTNTTDHHHFFFEHTNEVMDVPDGTVTVDNLPQPPEGMEIANVDVVIRLRPKRRRR